ncbi:MAG: hypothetical protein IKX65_03325 [Prevotella sp.]|nr:hypothetical protein [Prevotella sp.]
MLKKKNDIGMSFGKTQKNERFFDECLAVCKKECIFAAVYKKYKNATAKNEHIIDDTAPGHRRLWTDLLC